MEDEPGVKKDNEDLVLEGDQIAIVAKKYCMYKATDFYPRWYLEVITPQTRFCCCDWEIAEQYLLQEGFAGPIWPSRTFRDWDGIYIAWKFERI